MAEERRTGRRLARGAFLRRVAAAGAGVMLLPLAAKGTVAAAPATLDRAAFAGCLGQRFRVQVGSTDADMVLVRIVDWSRRPVAGAPATTGECFSALFRAPRQAAFPQGTYQFQHGRLGTFPLFVVPGAVTRRGQSYEALFNRLP